MEVGVDQLRTGLRPGSSRFALSRHVKRARTCLRPVWSQIPLRYPGAGLQRAGIWPITHYLAR